jgi:predicted nuclease of predicted toxin-antitoxin system
MNFIVDAQLPKSLSDFLNSKGHNSIHTLELDNKNKTSDNTIVEIAEKENRVVITKDYINYI